MTEAREKQAKEWLWQQVVNHDRVLAFRDVQSFMDGWKARNAIDNAKQEDE